LLGSERPGADGWEFDAEEGVGVLDRLGDATRDVLVEYGLAGLPVQIAHRAQEAGHGPLVVAGAVGLQGRPRIPEEGVRAGHREQRRLQQDEGVHDLGTVERELKDDRPTVGVAGDVRAPDIQVVEQATGVRGVVCDAHRRESVGAPGPTPPVVPDHAVAVGQRRLGEEWQEAPRHSGAAQQHGFARSDNLVFQLDAVDLCTVHESSSR
jgi:hypothetical protein